MRPETPGPHSKLRRLNHLLRLLRSRFLPRRLRQPTPDRQGPDTEQEEPAALANAAHTTIRQTPPPPWNDQHKRKAYSSARTRLARKTLRPGGSATIGSVGDDQVAPPARLGLSRAMRRFFRDREGCFGVTMKVAMLELAELDLGARAGVAQYRMERGKPPCGYISVRVWTRACSSKLSSSSLSSHFVLSCSGSVTFFLCLASSISRAVLSLQVTTPTSNLFLRTRRITEHLFSIHNHSK
ncbi:hypothetical protein BKA56DRAFT_359459 [Ilyonectria sp. MPI-CAGE-AT-0026]|nr:hypothetical protein BKA56DRAFT_359459 [Ilyonectria sp. MPI-CAGE-AT-0026]